MTLNRRWATLLVLLILSCSGCAPGTATTDRISGDATTAAQPDGASNTASPILADLIGPDQPLSDTAADLLATDTITPDATLQDALPTNDGTAQTALSCDPGVGVVAPLATCSVDAPCLNALVGKYNGYSFQTVTIDSTPPACQTANPNNPPFDDGPALSWTDSKGTTRYYCQFVPDGAKAALRPLVIWLHGAGGSADHLYNLTHLRQHASATVIGADEQQSGFLLIAVQGRNLHWPTIHPDGAHHDTFHRTLATNPDVQFLDQLIDSLVATQQVDTKRIYLMGWSNGAMFAQFYATFRHAQPTPGGHRVAAAAVFATANPFERLSWFGSAECAYAPLPTSNVPVYIVNRDCDALTACNATQQASFGLPPGHDLTTWLKTLRGAINNDKVTLQLIGVTATAVSDCALLCTQPLGLSNHARWPDGSTGDVKEWESAMLAFLRANPLP